MSGMIVKSMRYAQVEKISRVTWHSIMLNPHISFALVGFRK
jgi:hypothetical protein